MTRVAPTILTPVEATPRKSATQARRAAIIARDGPLCAGKGCSRPGVILDHRVPLELSGPDTLDNWQLLCRLHDLAKTAIDVRIIAKVRRIRKRLAGERKPRKPIASRPDPWPPKKSRGFGRKRAVSCAAGGTVVSGRNKTP